MKWWRVVKKAVEVGMKLGRVKEAKRITEIVEGIDTVITEATKPNQAPTRPE